MTVQENTPQENTPQEPIVQKDLTQSVQFYSTGAIGMATFLGGPLIGGYLIRENYRILQEEKKGKQALLWGIATTILVFGGLLLLPASVLDRLPSYVLPAIFAGVASWIVEVKQGAILRQHKEQNRAFYSNWKAAGLALIAALIQVVLIFVTAFFLPNDPAYETYQTQLDVFTQNEQKTLVFYDDLYTKPNRVLLYELEEIALPLWKENLQLINQTAQLENLPKELREHNDKLRTYSELRIEAFELFKRALSEDTDQYDSEIQVIHEKIDQLLNELN